MFKVGEKLTNLIINQQWWMCDLQQKLLKKLRIEPRQWICFGRGWDWFRRENGEMEHVIDFGGQLGMILSVIKGV